MQKLACVAKYVAPPKKQQLPYYTPTSPKPSNRTYSYSRQWTGSSLQLRLVQGNFIIERLTSFTFEKTPARVSLAS